jgi:hypothetical protein
MAKLPLRGSSPPTTAPQKVRAIRLGYYDHVRRRVGDVFTIQARAFSAVWMEHVDPNTPERLTTGAQDLRRQHDEILSGRAPSHDDDGSARAEDEDNPLNA